MRSASQVVVLFLVSVACSSTKPKSDAKQAAAPAVAAHAGPAATPQAPATPERSGTLVPAVVDAVSIWPQAYSGEMLVTEVLPHGSTVAKGDVIAKIETRALDEQIHQATLEARSSTIRHEGVVAKNAIEDDAAAAALDVAKASLDRARRSLEGWTKREIPFARRGDDIGKKNEEAGLDDQKDELSQLEKMYSADELVDATEEIVLKRAKRRLAISEDATGLSVDRRQYRKDLEEALQTETRQETVRTQELALDRLTRNQAIERKAREDALARSADALDLQKERLAKLERDRELFTIRAPRDGILLHGREKDYRPGRTPARFERGSQLSARNDVFLVADPAAFAVAVDLPESMLASVHDGARAQVQASGASAPGTVHLEAYPAAKAGGDEGTYEAKVDLEQPIVGVRFGMRAKVTFPATAPATEAAAGP